MSKWKKFEQIALTVGPIVLAAIPGFPIVLIPLLIHGIATAERLPHAQGAEKKAAVLALVTDGITALNVAKGTPVVDPVTVAGVVSQGIDTTVSVINLIQALPGHVAVPE